MPALRTKVAAALAATAMLSATTAAGVQGPGTLPNNTLVHITGGLAFRETIDGHVWTVKCPSFTASARAHNSAVLQFHAPPVITGCATPAPRRTGTLTASGTWSLKATTTTSTTMYLLMPAAGATFKPSWIPPCTVTWSAATVNGVYSSGNDTYDTTGGLPATATGCTVSSIVLGMDVTFSPAPGTVPPWG